MMKKVGKVFNAGDSGVWSLGQGLELEGLVVLNTSSFQGLQLVHACGLQQSFAEVSLLTFYLKVLRKFKIMKVLEKSKIMSVPTWDTTVASLH